MNPAPPLIAALIRHGDYHQLPGAPSALQPFPLTPEGEQQARQAVATLAQDLQQNGWRLHPVIDSSRLLRAWQTAELLRQGLAAESEAPITIDQFDPLAERSVGSAANLDIRQIEAILDADPRFEPPPPNWKADSHYRLPLQGAESLLEAGERVATHLRTRMQQLRAEIQAPTLKLFVGHGAAFRHAAYHLGILRFEEIARLSMYHAHPVYLEYLNDGRWRHCGGDWKIRGEKSEYRD